jgi:hypothetical protein
MSITTLPYHTLRAEELAKWLEDQPERWWVADGDDVLVSEISLPCTSDEMAEAILNHGQPLIIYETNREVAKKPPEVKAEDLDDFLDMRNPKKRRTLFLSWQGSNTEWLLAETAPLVD